MRGISELLSLPKDQLTKEEAEYLRVYQRHKKVRHASSFIYHSRKLPQEPNGTANPN